MPKKIIVRFLHVAIWVCTRMPQYLLTMRGLSQNRNTSLNGYRYNFTPLIWRNTVLWCIQNICYRTWQKCLSLKKIFDFHKFLPYKAKLAWFCTEFWFFKAEKSSLYSYSFVVWMWIIHFYCTESIDNPKRL